MFNQSSEAVLVIQAGGRVEFINPRARDWFGLRDDDVADIERLARRVRPPDEFLDVCASPSQKRVNVNGRLAELTSYQVPGPDPKMLVSLRGMELTPALTTQSADASSSILKVVSDFGQAIASSLDLETVLRSILKWWSYAGCRPGHPGGRAAGCGHDGGGGRRRSSGQRLLLDQRWFRISADVGYRGAEFCDPWRWPVLGRCHDRP